MFICLDILDFFIILDILIYAKCAKDHAVLFYLSTTLTFDT